MSFTLDMKTFIPGVVVFLGIMLISVVLGVFYSPPLWIWPASLVYLAALLLSAGVSFLYPPIKKKGMGVLEFVFWSGSISALLFLPATSIAYSYFSSMSFVFFYGGTIPLVGAFVSPVPLMIWKSRNPSRSALERSVLLIGSLVYGILVFSISSGLLFVAVLINVGF